MKKKRWTFKGIKRYAKWLEFEDWLKICRHGRQFENTPESVLAGLIEE